MNPTIVLLNEPTNHIDLEIPANRAIVCSSLPPRARNPSSRPWRPYASQVGQDLQHSNTLTRKADAATDKVY